jgi:uncharacterized protein YkwD
MKYIILLVILFIPIGCDKQSHPPIPMEHSYNYSDQELDLLSITNQYRQSMQLSTLQILPHISHLCEEHNLYMIESGRINHDYSYSRQVNLEQLYGATEIGEIVAYNYQTNQSVLQAWINSPDHFEILKKQGYTDFGVSITTVPTTNRKYYTFIFIKR